MSLSHRHRPSRSRYARYREHLRTLWRNQNKRRQEELPDVPKHEAVAPEYQPLRRMKKNDRERSFYSLLFALFRIVGSHWPSLAFALAVGTGASIVALAPPYGTKLVIDNVLGAQPAPGVIGQLLPADPHWLLASVALLMIALPLVATALNVAARWTMTLLARRKSVEMRRKVFQHLSELPLHRIVELKSGGIGSILRDDAGSVGELLFSLLYNPWRAVVSITGSLIILASVDWRLLLGGLTLLPVVYVTHRAWISRIRPLYQHIRDTRRHTDGHASEAFGGIRVVRGFGRRRSEVGAYARNTHLQARQEIYAWWWQRGIDIVWSIMIPTATACILWYGGERILADQAAVAAGTLDPADAITPGQLVMFIVYLVQLLGPIGQIASSAAGLQNGLAGLDRALELLDEPKEFERKSNAIKLNAAQVQGAIAIRNLSFTYPKTEAPVLSDVSLDVQAGQTIALVGRSGAGKTTLCNLIARFYDPDSGSISLDGVNLRDIDLESYRSILGIVEQDVFLFDGTVRENIAYSNRRATQQQIEEAAQRACAHEFITGFAEGYETLIGERGVKLSGGQRQRISIARALLADPRLLILDEATSNLDSESEQLIQQALQELLVGRTTFVIAHRLSTIRHANLIVVMQDGRVVEQGTHEQLDTPGGIYWSMLERQKLAHQDPNVLEE